MKKTLTAAIALGSLLTLSASTFAATDAFDGYYHAFYGTSSAAPSSEPMGKAAYGTSDTSSLWSGHQAYAQAFYGTPSTYEPATTGKAAHGMGTSSSGDGLKSYHEAFRGD